MAQTIQDRLKDLNWSLSEFDRIIDVVLSNLITLREELHGKNREKEKIAGNFHDVLNFKVETLYSLLIKLEELIFDTTFAYYRKYHGLIRGELSLVEFESVKREVSYIFDSFLTQYKSLLDLTIKYTVLFFSAGQKLSSQARGIDSFERLLSCKSKHKQTYKILNKSGVFQNFLKYKTAWDEIKWYRDYIIHHGYVKHQLGAKSTEGHVLFSYRIPLLIKKGKDYKVHPNSTLRLDTFCREKLYLLLSSIAELTDLIYDDSFKQPYISKLKTFAPELVKDVLLRISRKDFWADKVFFEEEKLKAFLRSKNIDFSELVEDFVYTHEEFDTRTKSGEGTRLLLEKIHYKPIGNIRIFRTKFIHEGDSEIPENRFKPGYGVMVLGVNLSDFISQDPKLEEILDTLRKSGLVYVVKTKEETRYASVRDDLKSLVVTLDELSRFKWSFIQVPEMQYFRPRTVAETELTRKIVGSGADEYLKKEDEERKRIQKEYDEWKKQPEHYFENPLRIVDKDNRVITRITHREFIEEKNVGFQNWAQNKKITLIEIGGKKKAVLGPFFTNKDMDQKWLKELIETCEKQWVGTPKHFLELQREWIEESKKKYKADLQKIKEDFEPILKKYDYLTPVFRLLNQDVFT